MKYQAKERTYIIKTPWFSSVGYWHRRINTLCLATIVVCIMIAVVIPTNHDALTLSHLNPSLVETVALEKREVFNLSTINKELRGFGSFLTAGMSPADYAGAMDCAWENVLVTGEPQYLCIDLTKAYSYDDLVNQMVDLARHDGVNLYLIGQSVNGRDIFALSIDFEPSATPVQTKPALLFTGQVHANEFAGAVYILKQFSELVYRAQKEPETRALLEQVRFEAIPVVNPDGREKNIADNTSTWKSNVNGVDLNRNFPSAGASQLANGVKRTPYYSTSPSLRYYSGPSLGSEPETKAVIKWLEVHVPHAFCYLDYHQQGRGLYYGKPWDIKSGESNVAKFGQSLIKFLNQGVYTRQYFHIPNEENIGLNGSGGSITDYALAVARGLTYSLNYGVLTLNVDGIDQPLVKFRDLDHNTEHYNPKNHAFCAATVEITRREGFGDPLGYSLEARKLMHEEYYKHNYDKLLVYLARMALGL